MIWVISRFLSICYNEREVVRFSRGLWINWVVRLFPPGRWERLRGGDDWDSRLSSCDLPAIEMSRSAVPIFVRNLNKEVYHASQTSFAGCCSLCCGDDPGRCRDLRPGRSCLPRSNWAKSIFEDENLSISYNQSCATCHGSNAGWTGPDSDTNAGGAVYMGSITGAFGDRKPPSAAYATQSPILSVDRKGVFTGGNFWDGRATGETLGSPAAEQAQGPFLNPAEQALPIRCRGGL